MEGPPRVCRLLSSDSLLSPCSPARHVELLAPVSNRVRWQERFRDKLVSADEAVRRVKSGDLVRFVMGPVPVTLVNALARRRDELHGVRVHQGAARHAAAVGDAPSPAGKSTCSSSPTSSPR